MEQLSITMEKNLLDQIRIYSKIVKPDLFEEEEGFQLFIQDLFVRLFMDLQPHDLIYASISQRMNSNLRCYPLSIIVAKAKTFISVLEGKGLSGHDNVLIEVRSKLLRAFNSDDPLLTISQIISLN